MAKHIDHGSAQEIFRLLAPVQSVLICVMMTIIYIIFDLVVGMRVRVVETFFHGWVQFLFSS